MLLGRKLKLRLQRIHSLHLRKFNVNIPYASFIFIACVFLNIKEIIEEVVLVLLMNFDTKLGILVTAVFRHQYRQRDKKNRL
jgi:hypothetical protein